MLSPNESVLRALVNLESSPDFQVVVQWFNASYDQELADCAEITEVHRLRWSQGRSQELKELTSTVSDARRILLSLGRGR